MNIETSLTVNSLNTTSAIDYLYWHTQFIRSFTETQQRAIWTLRRRRRRERGKQIKAHIACYTSVPSILNSHLRFSTMTTNWINMKTTPYIARLDENLYTLLSNKLFPLGFYQIIPRHSRICDTKRALSASVCHTCTHLGLFHISWQLISILTFL